MLREERPCPTVRHLTSAFGAQCKGVAAPVVVALDGFASGAEILRVFPDHSAARCANPDTQVAGPAH